MFGRAKMKLKQFEKSKITKEKILSSAVDEFAEKGFYGARVDKIAEAANVNKRMIYAHFESKENLYSEVLLIAYQWVADCEREFMIEDITPTEAIRLMIRRSFEFLLYNPKFIRLLMWENLNRAISIPKEELVKLKTPTFEYMKKQVRRGKDSGEFRTDADEHQIVLSLMNFPFAHFSNAHTMSALLKRDLASHDDVISRADSVSDMIIKYLKV